MELWDVYTYDRVKTGRTVVRGSCMQSGDYHLVADMWIMNSRGQVLIQQRSFDKETAPGLWSCTGGSVVAGEDTYTAMCREVEEELGVAPDLEHTRLLFSCHGKNSIKDIYLIRQDIRMEQFSLQKEEVLQVRWVSLDELRNLTQQPEFFHALGYFEPLFEHLNKEAQSC